MIVITPGAGTMRMMRRSATSVAISEGREAAMTKSIRFIAFLVLFASATTGVAYALTARIRTSDWKLVQNMYSVLYWADYNAAYGTSYYVVTVGK
jgi:hypothetical protein